MKKTETGSEHQALLLLLFLFLIQLYSVLKLSTGFAIAD
jgi:hypothetical protein